MPQYLMKIGISLVVIMTATEIGRRIPSLGGLIATMPLTGLLVLVWLYLDVEGEHTVMTSYARGTVWGTIPSILFFITVMVCFQKRLPLMTTLSAGFAVWLVGAVVHQLLLR